VATECDSVHSNIEQAVKKKDIFSPSHYIDNVPNLEIRIASFYSKTQIMVNWTEINITKQRRLRVSSRDIISYTREGGVDDAVNVKVKFSNEIDGTHSPVDYRSLLLSFVTVH
jgi:hypothetical protein